MVGKTALRRNQPFQALISLLSNTGLTQRKALGSMVLPRSSPELQCAGVAISKTLTGIAIELGFQRLMKLYLFNLKSRSQRAASGQNGIQPILELLLFARINP